MAKNDVAVLDFGSGKLTLVVGKRTVNNNFIITASSDIEYAGFMDGEFIEEDELYNVINQAVQEVQSVLNKPLNCLYVGVPSEFCEVSCKRVTKDYGKKIVLNNKKIDELFIDADSNIISNTHTVINISPVCYTLDGTNITFNPLDCYAKSIDVDLCFVLADDRFISLVGRILKDLKIREIEYVSSILAEGQYLLDGEIRDQGALLVDCGYLTTTITYFNGEGIVELKNFPMGGAHITAGLCENLNLPYSVAEQVKQKLLISVKATGIDSYDVYRSNRIEKVSSQKANELALEVIDSIVNGVLEEINRFEEIPSEHECVYLTGGGISYLKGIEYYMSSVLQRKVQVIAPRPLKLRKPDLSSIIGLLDAALKME